MHGSHVITGVFIAKKPLIKQGDEVNEGIHKKRCCSTALAVLASILVVYFFARVFTPLWVDVAFCVVVVLLIWVVRYLSD
jgi:hypothetical protein